MLRIDHTRIIDLAVPLREGLEVCRAHPPVRITRIADGSAPDADGPWTAERLEMGTHCGTHMDAPLHFIPGARALDQFPPTAWCGPAAPLDLAPLGEDMEITDGMFEAAARRLERPIERGDIALIRTGWFQRRSDADLWQFHSAWLNGDAARWLVDQGVKGVAIDHYSIGKGAPGFDEAPHGALLGAGVWIGEDVDMPDALFDGRRWFFAMNPLSIAGASGAPARPWAAPIV